MPINVAPHEHIERVVVYTFSDPWTWDELMLAFEQEQRYAATLAPGETYMTLVLIHQARAMAPGLSLSHFQYMQRHNPSNWDCLVLVRNPASFFNPLFAAASQFPAWRGRIILADTPEAAEHIIHQRRQAE